MDPANRLEAITETLRDIEEGADIVMINPDWHTLISLETSAKILKFPLLPIKLVENMRCSKPLLKKAGWITIRL